MYILVFRQVIKVAAIDSRSLVRERDISAERYVVKENANESSQIATSSFYSTAFLDFLF